MARRRINIERFIESLRKSSTSWNPPVVTLVAARGATPFEILVSTVLSARTKDEVTAAAAARLFKVARTPEALVLLGERTLERLIYPVGFYPTKAKHIKRLSRVLLDHYGGLVPRSLEQLLTLPGVGRKTANLVLIEAFGKPAVCVDTHVHRISNRIGYVSTKTPEQTEQVLREKLPRKHWIHYNELLVAFGQEICKPLSPVCSVCPVFAACPRKGVTRSR
ncbi:endonuclease III domain-containing protein [Thermodesulfobacteriota bacterium]